MKKLSLRILASLMALLLIMGLAACGGNSGGSESDAGSESSNNVSESSQPDLSAPESSNTETSKTDAADSSTDTSKTDTGKTNTGNSNVAGTTTSRTQSNRTVQDARQAKTWAEIKAMIPASAKGVTLKVYDWNPVTEVPGLSKVNENFIKETGIKIDYIQVDYYSYFTKIAAEVAAKNAPDAVRVQNPFRKELSYLQPLNDLGYDFTDPAWDKTVLDAYTFNGNLYAVNMAGSPIYSPYVVYYNKNLIDTYGLDDPYQLWKKGKWNWTALWDLCEEFVDQAEGDGVYGLSTMAGFEYQVAYNKPPIVYDKATNTFKHNLNDTAFVKSWQTYANKCQDGLVSLKLTDNDTFDAGKLLFNISTGIASRNGSAYFKQLRSKNAVACVPLPALNAKSKDYQLIQEVQAFGVPKTAKNAKLVPYYLRYYFDAKNYDMKTFYNVENAAEVIKYIQSKSPEICYADAIINMEYAKMGTDTLINKLKAYDGSVVQKTLDSVIPAIDASIKDNNAFYANL